MRRRRRSLVPPLLPFRDASIPALALLELGERLQEVPGPEVGPQHGRHVDLGVRDLPEQVVRDAHLTARTDEQIRVGKPGRIELRFDRRLVDVLGIQHAGLHLFRERAHRVGELGAARVVEGDVEDHALSARRRGERLLQLALDGDIEAVHAPHHAEDDVVVEERPQLPPQVFLQERHERRDLEVRALPVLRRECIERQRRELQARGRLDRRAHGIDPGAVTFDARQAALTRPTPVSVHDDGDVPRKAAEVEHLEERPVG